MRSVHIAYVTPRYGADIIGGAELGVRMFAERLVEHLGWRVDVLTTSARDMRTWANEPAPRDALERGVHVYRFPTAAPRAHGFERRSQRLLAIPTRATGAEARRAWIRDQGPHSPELLDAIAQSPADAVVFYPYLYEPTVLGIERVRQPCGDAPGRTRRATDPIASVRRRLPRRAGAGVPDLRRRRAS